MMIDREACLVALHELTRDDFSSQAHQFLFGAAAHLVNSGSPVDIVTMAERLQQESHADTAGGVAYLSQLANFVPTAANTEHYAQIVKDKSRLRRARHALVMMQACMADAETADEFYAKAESEWLRAAQMGAKAGAISLLEVGRELLHRLQTGEKPEAWGTGIRALDGVLEMEPKSLVVLAAESSRGKTAFALKVLSNMVIYHNRPSAFFSLEQSREEIFYRWVAMETGIPFMLLRRGNIPPEKRQVVEQKMLVIPQLPFLVDDTPLRTASQIAAAVRRLKLQYPRLGLFVVDYLNILGGLGDDRPTSLGEACNILRSAAKETNTVCLALSQFNRPENIRDKPSIHRIRDSAAVGFVADQVLLIHHPDKYHAGYNDVELIVEKNRNGFTGSCTVQFLGRGMRFE